MKYSDKINFVNRDDKKLLGGIQMNTKTFEQFDVMTDVELAKVEGGKKCNYSQVIFDGFMGAAAGAAGNVPGIVIGGIGGAVLSYGGYCL